MPFHWSADRLDQLEAAIRNNRRVALMRRGTEYVILPRRLDTSGRRDKLVGYIPMTGEELEFTLEEIDAMQVI